MHRVRLLGIGVLAAVLACSTGCTGSGIPAGKAKLLREQLDDRGLIVGLEGLQPFSGHSTDYLTQDVARAAGLAQSATSGNGRAHLPFIKVAHKNGQPIYIVGYSMGAAEARSLAAICHGRDIPIRGLFLLDPPSLGGVKIPDNVHRAVVYLSGARGGRTDGIEPTHLVRDPQRTSIRVEGLSMVDHIRLPYEVAPMVMSEVLADLRRLGAHESP